MPQLLFVSLWAVAWACIGHASSSSSSSSSTNPCDVSIVGAGWGGVYSAWRLAVDSGSTQKVCLFEAYQRPGGRTYTVSLGDFVVDVGAYRFALDMHLPADLIRRGLRMRSVCYDPECLDDDVRGEVAWPYQEPLSKIVDFSGRHIGYGAAIDLMLSQFVTVGGSVIFGAELSSLSRAEGGEWTLGFRSDAVVKSRAVIVNLPRSALSQVAGMEAAAGDRWSALSCRVRDFPPNLAEGATTVKVYAVYDDAWWVSKLNLLRGVKEDLAEPPVSIHYHDGEVLCYAGTAPGGEVIFMPARDAVEKNHCRGVLQVFYRHSQVCPASSPHCMDYWANLPRKNASDPLTVVGVEGASGVDEASALLRVVHEKLLQMHSAEFAARNISRDIWANILPPTSLAYSVWAHEGTFPKGDRGLLSGPQDVLFAPGSLTSVCGVSSPSVYEDMVQGTASMADVAPGLHFANNDLYATPAKSFHGPWAEQSLITAERVLAAAFRLPRPPWLNETYYNKYVRTRAISSESSDVHSAGTLV